MINYLLEGLDYDILNTSKGLFSSGKMRSFLPS